MFDALAKKAEKGTKIPRDAACYFSILPKAGTVIVVEQVD